jgi:alkylation response protein AidB-like acyl-CoA dehydrogenase
VSRRQTTKQIATQEEDAAAQRAAVTTGSSCPAGRAGRIMDIFEGTEQIQQLVIARALSGLRIE